MEVEHEEQKRTKDEPEGNFKMVFWKKGLTFAKKRRLMLGTAAALVLVAAFFSFVGAIPLGRSLYVIREKPNWNFINKQKVKKVIIRKGVKEIGDTAFYGCSSLSSVEIPEGVTKIGDYAFVNCISLKSVKIPESVEEIGEEGFAGCSSLSNVEISVKVKLGKNAFNNCPAREKIFDDRWLMSIIESERRTSRRY